MSRWQELADELDAAHARGEIDDDCWFDGMAAIFDTAYLEGENPRAQSGFGGDEARWEVGRRPIVEAVDRDGTFLDIGCASGLLMESLVRWSPHRLDPYGLELAPAVAELARRRLPQWRDRIFTGNALYWEPPMRFDFVRTELVYVPAARKADFVQRLLDRFLVPGGRLILCGYGSPRSGLRPDPVQRTARELGYTPTLELSAEAPEGGPIVEIAVLTAGSGMAAPP